MRPNTNPTIDLQLPLEIINKVLNLLGSHPFNDVADMIIDIRNQTGQQIEKLQQAMQVPNMPQRANGEDRGVVPS
jgi:hypothetical protein